jgi:hypothetical protein
VIRKWRDFLLNEGACTWTREFADKPENKSKYWSDPVYRRSVRIKKGRCHKPPKLALEAVETLILEQEAVWEEMFGSKY